METCGGLLRTQRLLLEGKAMRPEHCLWRCWSTPLNRRIFRNIENNFAYATFVFVQNGKISSKNSIFKGGIGGWTAKYIITSRGEIPIIKEKRQSLLCKKAPPSGR